MVKIMNMKKRMKISNGGQVSIPASIRRRWATSTLILEDRGEEIVLKPTRDDPIEAAAGAFSGLGPNLDLQKIRREEREAEREAEERKFGL